MTTSTAAPPVCEVENLVMHFGRVRAVDGVSFRIDPGMVLALVGESGAGKSTVGRCIVRLHEPTAGAVRLGGTDIAHLSKRQLRTHRRRASIIFQDPASSLDPRLTVRDIVAEPLRLQRLSDRAGRARRVQRMLELVGLRNTVADRYPHELSGGQRQRVSIARALVASPSLLIADEPTSALDVSVQASVLNLLADLQRELHFACLFITHNLSAVTYLADDVAVMYLGQIVECGPRDQIFDRPRHPYTQALLAAAPLLDPVSQRGRARIVLSGEIPSSSDPPPGCRFHTRCPVRVDRCMTEIPELREADSRLVSCHLVTDDQTGPDLTRLAARRGER